MPPLFHASPAISRRSQASREPRLTCWEHCFFNCLLGRQWPQVRPPGQHIAVSPAPTAPRQSRPVHLTRDSARALHLAAQGLAAAPPAKLTPDDVLQAIRRMQLLQIDTIHVVARSPYLVLFSRLPTYRP